MRFADLFKDLLRQFFLKVCGNALCQSVKKGTFRLFLILLEELLVESMLFGDLFDELLVVQVAFQSFSQLFADDVTEGTVLSGDVDDDFFFHGVHLLSFFSQGHFLHLYCTPKVGKRK